MINLSLLGKGFIGTRYDEMFPGSEIVLREFLTCSYPKILNFRSTVHNYHPIDGNPYIDIETNLLDFMRMLKFMECQYGSNSEINFVSSWFVLGKTKCPATEDSPCDPRGFYSITKRCAEQLLISYCETFSMKYRIMRLANVIGVGDQKISKRKNALQYLVSRIVKGEPIEIYKDDVVRDYIWVDDVCKAIQLVITEGKLNTIYNISNGIPLSLHKLIQYVIDKVGYDVDKISYIETPKFHRVVQVRNMYLNNLRISRLGYVPSKSVYEVLDELVDYYGRN